MAARWLTSGQWFVPEEGIAREVITSDIQRYLGPDSLVRPGKGEYEYTNTDGYLITSIGPPTPSMIQDLKMDSQEWAQERKSAGTRGTAYQDSRTHAARQHWGPSEHVQPHARWSQAYSPTSGATPLHTQTAYPGPITAPDQYVSHDSRPSLEAQDSQAQIEAFKITRRQLKKKLDRYQAVGDLSPSQYSNAAQSFPVDIRRANELLDDRMDEGQRILQPALPLNNLAELCGWQISAEKFLYDAEPSTSLIVTEKGKLGRGSIGEVEEVTVRGHRLTMARKRMLISRWQRQAAREMMLMRREIENLKSLIHPHIVTILGCYPEGHGTRNQSFCALMYPVGDNDLAAFLYHECQGVRSKGQANTYTGWILKWFWCLASALTFMHSQNVHHEDVKPSNIIHRGGDVYFTDFSSSRKLESEQETSTASPALASRMFAAPEAFGSDGIVRHGSKTDVYSLGLVFMEMLVILDGKDVGELRDWLDGQVWAYNPKQYNLVTHIFPDWFTKREVAKMYRACVQPMLQQERTSRPSALEVTSLLRQEQLFGPVPTCCFVCHGSNG